MSDRYASYVQLAESEREGQDYSVRVEGDRSSAILVLAPHGGSIEPGTSELAALSGSSKELVAA